MDRTQNNGGNTPIVNNPAMNDPTLGQLPGFFSSAVTLTSTGVTNLTGGNIYGASIQDFWGQIRQFYDDAFWSHGHHGFKFGFEMFGYHDDGYTPLAGGNGSGTFTYRGVYNNVSGAQTPTAPEAFCPKAGFSAGDPNTALHYDTSCGSLVNFLTNQPDTAARPVDLSAISKHYLRQMVFGGYFQDDWQMKPNLTLNLGLRYEMATNPTEKYRQVSDLANAINASSLRWRTAIVRECQPNIGAEKYFLLRESDDQELRTAAWLRLGSI